MDLAALIGKKISKAKPPEKDPESEPEDKVEEPADEDGDAIAETILTAIDDKDAAELASALKAFARYCKSSEE